MNMNENKKSSIQSKKALKQARRKLIENYRPSPERQAEFIEKWERLTYKILVTEDWDDFHQF